MALVFPWDIRYGRLVGAYSPPCCGKWRDAMCVTGSKPCVKEKVRVWPPYSSGFSTFIA